MCLYGSIGACVCLPQDNSQPTPPTTAKRWYYYENLINDEGVGFGITRYNLGSDEEEAIRILTEYFSKHSNEKGVLGMEWASDIRGLVPEEAAICRLSNDPRNGDSSWGYSCDVWSQERNGKTEDLL